MGLYAPIKIMLADDHELLRDGFQVMMKKQTDIEMIGEAGNGEELIRIARELRPDVIVTDIKMPKMNGVEATKRLTKEFPHIGIIALSMFDEDNLIIDMLEAGAKGYLLKNAHKDEIIAAIKTVHQGEVYYCRHTTSKLALMIGKSNFNPYRKVARSPLSEKEIAVIQLICKEYSNKEMAADLGLSIRTVEGYREQILEKIHAKNTVGIVIYAIKNNIYTP